MTETLGRIFLIGALVCAGLWFATSSGVWMGPGAVLGLLWLIIGIWNRSKDDDTIAPGSAVHGSARFATPAELRSKCAASTRGAAVPLGKVGGEHFFYRTEKHVLLLVSTGGGKGVSYILPNLLSYQGSVFVTDPKGENANYTAPYRATLGKVCVLDPWELAEGDAVHYRTKFNPLDAIIRGDKRAILSRSRAMVKAFAVVKENNHWQRAAEDLLTALIAHVCTADGLEQPRDLVTVRDMLMENFEPADDPPPHRAQNLKTGEETRPKPPRPVATLDAMRRNTACDGAIRREALGLLNRADEERSGIVSTAQVASSLFEDGYIRSFLRPRKPSRPYTEATGFADAFENIFSEFFPPLDFEEWRRGVMSVYLCAPSETLTNYPNFLRLITSSALATMMQREEVPAAGPVQFVLDELGFIGFLDGVKGTLGMGRSYGLQLWGIFQNISMIREHYQDSGIDTFWNNAGVRIAFATTSETSDYVSKQTGGATVTTRSDSTTQSSQGASSSQSTGEAGRPLLTPHEVTTRYSADSGQALVFVDGLDVAAVERLIYFRDEPYNSRRTEPPKG